MEAGGEVIQSFSSINANRDAVFSPRSCLFSRRLPYTFVTKEVLEATCECLLEQAKKAEQTHQPQAEAERLILEEFGHCLMRIISSAGKAKADCASINC